MSQIGSIASTSSLVEGMSTSATSLSPTLPLSDVPSTGATRSAAKGAADESHAKLDTADIVDTVSVDASRADSANLRQKRVEAIMKQVQQNTYRVSSSDLAQALLRKGIV